MASEAVTVPGTEGLTEDRREQLKANRWVCDYETHRILWEAQCMLDMIDCAMESNHDRFEQVQIAVQGVERLLAGAIARTGWSAIGHGTEA